MSGVIGRIIALALALAALPGCNLVRSLGGPGGELRVQSLSDEPVLLTGRFVTAFYSYDEDRTSFIVSDVPAEQLVSGEFDEGQVYHFELLWVPKAGATPMDPTATNVSIRHVVFSGGQVGVYGGAGFALPSGRPGRGRMSLSFRQASLRLLESTDRFVDLLSPAELVGNVTAEHDRVKTRRLYFNVSQHVTNTLGRTRFVDAGCPGPGRQTLMSVIFTRR